MNENMYTDKNDKVRVNVESFGAYARLTLDKGQNGTAHTMFANFAWGCEVEKLEEQGEAFMAPKKTVANILKIFREFNKVKRIEGVSQSPFIFHYIGQAQTYYKDLDITPYRFRVSEHV